MANHKGMEEFLPLNLAVLTVSDSRSMADDTSGQLLADKVEESGHQLCGRDIVKDDIYQIRAVLSDWIARDNINVVVVTGGTGFTERDNTPQAVTPLFDRQVDGFGELFRQVSFKDIGSATIQSRAFAGLANNTVIFCMPGSPNACRTAWDEIIVEQIDSRSRPCNFVPHLNLQTPNAYAESEKVACCGGRA
jgi:molybdenum cofactor biosynthesis protein B